jgi:dihydroorotate dehydrogenase
VLKIAPDLDDEQIALIADLLPAQGIDAVIATNTTVSRDSVAGEENAGQTGGLSGAPVFDMSNQVIRALRERLPVGYPIIGVGGILSAADACAKIEAGASVVQMYTGIIYRGPSLISDCARALAHQAATGQAPSN